MYLNQDLGAVGILAMGLISTWDVFKLLERIVKYNGRKV